MVSRGHAAAVRAILPVMKATLGARRFAEILNTKVGKSQSGTVDIALKNKIELVGVLKSYHGVEQRAPDASWVPGRRRSSRT